MATSKISNTVPALGNIKWSRKTVLSDSANAITTTSTKNLLQLGIIGENNNTYLIMVYCAGIVGSQDLHSMYFVRRTPDSETPYTVTTIFKGTNPFTIIIGSDGVPKRTGGTTAAAVTFVIADLGYNGDEYL